MDAGVTAGGLGRTRQPAREGRGRILAVDYQMLTPDHDSGSASTYAILDGLRSEGFEVSFVPFDMDPRPPHDRKLAEIGVRVLARPEWSDLAALMTAQAPLHDVVLAFRGPTAQPVLALARDAAPDMRRIFHSVDLHFHRMDREARLSGRAEDAIGAAEMRRIEMEAMAIADTTIVVSAHEKALLDDMGMGTKVRCIPLMRRTPPAPASYAGSWLARLLSGWSTFRQRRDIVFVGNFNHAPNGDGLHWFVREVWPLLLSKGYPDRFIIAGSHVKDDIAALASNRIEVRGYVADLGALFAACRLNIAPLRYGAGIKGKIVTGLAHGIPAIATPMAAEGMQLVDGEEILIGDGPEAFAEAVMQAYGSERRWRTLARKGHAAFVRRFSLERNSCVWAALMDELIEAHAP